MPRGMSREWLTFSTSPHRHFPCLSNCRWESGENRGERLRKDVRTFLIHQQSCRMSGILSHVGACRNPQRFFNLGLITLDFFKVFNFRIKRFSLFWVKKIEGKKIFFLRLILFYFFYFREVSKERCTSRRRNKYTSGEKLKTVGTWEGKTLFIREQIGGK